MQDEVTKHTKKIFSIIGSAKRSFGGKVKEVAIEIFIIVFAVTLSIWLHSWSQHVHQQKEVKEFLADVKDDLKEDIKKMSETQSDLSKVITNYDFLKKFTEKEYNNLAKDTSGERRLRARVSATISFRKNNNANYEGFKSSGKIGFIENKKLKKLILAYYQQNIPALSEADIYYFESLRRISDYFISEADKSMKEKLLSPKFKMHIAMTLTAAKNNQMSYESFIIDAKDIIAEIEKEMK